MSSQMIGEFSEGELLDVAKGVVEKKTMNSSILDVETEDRIPRFSTSGMSSRICLGIIFF